MLMNSLDLNDDVFFDKSKKLVVSVDTYIDKSHFFDFKDPDLVIKKILRSSISDLICKGVKPKYYFISGSGNKKTFTISNLKKISQSLKQEQKKFSIHISGGDTVFSNKLSFTIICVGFSSNIIFRNKAKFNYQKSWNKENFNNLWLFILYRIFNIWTYAINNSCCICNYLFENF